MSDRLIEWQLEVTSLFGDHRDVEITISGDGVTNHCEATYLPTGHRAAHDYPRALIKTSADQTTQMMVAVDKLYLLTKEAGVL